MRVARALILGGLASLAGCQGEEVTDSATVDGSVYLLDVEPEGGQDVISARKTSKDQGDVVVIGRIGGSETPFVKGLAAFEIVDSSLKACSDIPGDKCPKPWDYCCDLDKLPMSKVLVKVVDRDGEIVMSDARRLLKLKELQTVVVTGKAQRDEAGNMTVLAHGVFVRN